MVDVLQSNYHCIKMLTKSSRQSQFVSYLSKYLCILQMKRVFFLFDTYNYFEKDSLLIVNAIMFVLF